MTVISTKNRISKKYNSRMLYYIFGYRYKGNHCKASKESRPKILYEKTTLHCTAKMGNPVRKLTVISIFSRKFDSQSEIFSITLTYHVTPNINMYPCFRRMKRSLDGDEEVQRTPPINAILQQAAINLIARNLEGHYQPTGENVLDLTSPCTPAPTIKPKNLIQSYPKSSFWMKQLGKQDLEEPALNVVNQQTNTTANNKLKSKGKREIVPEDWENITAAIKGSKAFMTKTLIDVISKIQQEKTENTNNRDPISNRELKPAGRRAFFLKEWENHIHELIIKNMEKEVGLPYKPEKQISKLQIKNGDIEIQINLSCESQTELNLLKIYGETKSDIEKNNVFEILFLQYAISFNCLRPQTGKNTQKHKNSTNTPFKLILRTKNTWDGPPNTGVKTSKFKLKNKITERYVINWINRTSKINISRQLMSILCKKNSKRPLFYYL